MFFVPISELVYLDLKLSSFKENTALFMVESFLRMTKTREKLNVEVFTAFFTLLYNF